MKKTLIFAALAGIASLPAVAADSYTIDPRHTFPSFELSHQGFSIQRGRFNRTAGKMTLDTAAKSGSIDVTIDATSIDTGLDELEKHLRGEDFFDAAKYPTLAYKSTTLKFDGDKVTGANGELTLHGVTKPVSLNIDHWRCAPNPMHKKQTCGANATATIKRSDFGVSKYVPMVGDEVRIAIQVEAVRD